MRTVGSRCPFAALGLGLDSPPLPLSATFNLGSLAWSCTFDQPLQAGALDFANWSLRASGDAYTATSAAAAGSVVSGIATIATPAPAADDITFAPPPFDVLSLAGLPAIAFADFPLVVT